MTTHAPDDAPETTGAVSVLRRLIERRDAGESRPQQEAMVTAVENAITTRAHLLAQAGTGTGKSLAYLIPAVLSGRRVVVTTATKQLGEQLAQIDLPIVQDALPHIADGKTFTFALSKGRSNYACKAKIHELVALDEQAPTHEEPGLFEVEMPAKRESPAAPTSEDLKALNAALAWAETTETGDRSEAPACSDKVWNQISTDSAGCPGAQACPFASQCFAETARANASEADVVVTNHAQVAQDLVAGHAIFGDYDVLIADEMHELVSYLSSAWGREFSAPAARQHVQSANRLIPKDDEQATNTALSLIEDIDALADLLGQEEAGVKTELPEVISSLIATCAQKSATLARFFKSRSEAGTGLTENQRGNALGASGKMVELAETFIAMLDASDATVRWLEGARGNRQPVLKTAPLWVGPRLQELLGDITLVGTSATITVGGSFDSAVRNLSLNGAGCEDGATLRPYSTIDVGSPFDYPRQGMLYIPGPHFPDPVGADRFEHTKAVLDELVALVTAAGGRTLALFTTTKAAQDAAEHLRSTIATPVLCQGEAPPSQLVDEFVSDETSTLCATAGFWHGVNAPGATCTLVVIDKLPFAPMNDPLMEARRKAADNDRRNGFTEVFVADAAIKLGQGSGRLIRTGTDKGVVAILDRRIITKGYGRAMQAAVPDFRVFHDRDTVESALRRLTGSTDTATAPRPKPATATGRAAKSGGRAPSARSTRAMAGRTRGR